MAGSDVYPLRLDRPLGWLRPPDVLLFAYAAASGLALAWGAWHGVPRCAEQLGVTAAVVAGLLVVAAIARGTRRAPVAVLRLAYIPVAYWFFYHQVEVIWPVFHVAPFDAAIASFDERLFGFQPSLAFQAALPSRALGELFSFAYFAYYLYVPAVMLAVLARSGYRAAERVVFGVTLCFYCCYAYFWLVPTVGPHFWFPPHAGPQLYPGYVFNHLLFLFTGGGEIQGGAFPSSHVAVALLLTLYARRDAPRLFPYLAAITSVMLFAVVYLRAHYAVDVPAGLAVGLLFWRIANRWPTGRVAKPTARPFQTVAPGA